MQLYESLAGEHETISARQPNYPLIESFSFSNPPVARNSRGTFTKTEQLPKTVPGCSQGDAAPEGPGRPEYKPLMRKPREACDCLQPDRLLPGTLY